MLNAVPKGWFTPDFTILQNDVPVADLDLSLWREAAELSVGGEIYQVYREGMISGAFLLEAKSGVIARADKPHVFLRSFEVEYDGGKYILEAESAMMRKFVLRNGETEIGSIYPEHAFTSRAIVDLPEEMPLAVRLFLFWLVALMWKRAQTAKGGAV